MLIEKLNRVNSELEETKVQNIDLQTELEKCHQKCEKYKFKLEKAVAAIIKLQGLAKQQHKPELQNKSCQVNAER